MGMYTELHFYAQLKKSTPEQVLDVLRCMVEGTATPTALPNHPLFESERWDYMARSDSYYFDADTVSSLRFDDIAGAYYLNIRSNLKNYGNEIRLFLSWIVPFLDKHPGEFLGFYRYEEDEWPTLLHMGDDGLSIVYTATAPAAGRGPA